MGYTPIPKGDIASIKILKRNEKRLITCHMPRATIIKIPFTTGSSSKCNEHNLTLRSISSQPNLFYLMWWLRGALLSHRLLICTLSFLIVQDNIFFKELKLFTSLFSWDSYLLKKLNVTPILSMSKLFAVCAKWGNIERCCMASGFFFTFHKNSFSTSRSFNFINMPQTSLITKGFACIKYFIKHIGSRIKNLINRRKRFNFFNLLSENIISLKKRMVFRLKKSKFSRKFVISSLSNSILTLSASRIYWFLKYFLIRFWYSKTRLSRKITFCSLVCSQ